MSTLFDEMTQALSEARAYMKGECQGYKVALPESIDVRAIRKTSVSAKPSSPTPSASPSTLSAIGSPAAAPPKPPPEPT